MTLGRLRVSCERASRFRLWPVVSAYREDDPAAQDYYNMVWAGDVFWLFGWWQWSVSPH